MKKLCVILLVTVFCLCGCGKADDYEAAVTMMQAEDYEEAIAAFSALGNYKDSIQKTEECQKQLRYEKANQLYASGMYEEAHSIFLALGDFGESPALAEECGNILDYRRAGSLMYSGKYTEAIEVLERLGDYADSTQKLEMCRKAIAYSEAMELFYAERYEEARSAFMSLGTYNDSAQKKKACDQHISYAEAQKLLDEERYEEALAIFTELEAFADSADQAKEYENTILYLQAVMLADEGNYAEALELFLKVSKPHEFKEGRSYIKLCQTHIMLSDPLFSNIEKVMGMDFQAEDIEYGISKIGGSGIGPDALNVYFFPKNYQVLDGSYIFKMKGGSCLKLPMTYGELYQAGWWATNNEYGCSFSFIDAELEDTFPDDSCSPIRLQFGNSCGEELFAKVGNPGSDSITLSEAQLERFDVSKDFDLNGITQESDAMDVLAQFGLPYVVEQVIYREGEIDRGTITFEYFGNPEERDGGYLVFSFDASTGSLRNVGYALRYTTYHI